jgi:hypothetical protein
MRELTLQERLIAVELASRHYIPSATVQHPQGVIVPGDKFMTDKLRDPDYVPYCLACSPAQRLRRIEEGFQCPCCNTKANWDLTTFNDNVDVEFEPEHAEAGDIARMKLRAAKIAAEQLIRETPAYPPRYWGEDEGKKNTSLHACGKCGETFFGKNKRKYCKICQTPISANQAIEQRARQRHPYMEPPAAVNRKERRRG